MTFTPIPLPCCSTPRVVSSPQAAINAAAIHDCERVGK